MKIEFPLGRELDFEGPGSLKMILFLLLPLSDFFHCFEIFNFQFSSITHFLSHNIEDPSCRICSYGPHGPFWFSVKNRRDMVKRYQKKKNGEKSLFEIIAKMN